MKYPKCPECGAVAFRKSGETAVTTYHSSFCATWAVDGRPFVDEEV